MFRVRIKPEILAHCRKLIQKCNFGQRGVADGSTEEQLTGIIGQCTIQDLFGKPWVNCHNGFDGGWDFEYAGLKIDVKTMGRTTEVRMDYVNNFVGYQKYFPADIFIFCSFHKKKKELTVCGWIPKKEFFEKALFLPTGTIRTRKDGTSFKTKAPMYEIENFRLRPVSGLEELKEDLKKFGENVHKLS